MSAGWARLESAPPVLVSQEGHACLLLQVLKDDTTLADNSVSETGFMVVMVSKARTLVHRRAARRCT